MPVPLECPELASWRTVLVEEVPAEERERYEQHLESCPVCQERLDRGEVCREAWRRLGRSHGDPTATPPEPALSRVLERLHEQKSLSGAVPAEPADLYFLLPSDRPGVLGTLGSYEVLGVIGQGGMGLVLKAFEPALNRFVAIKVMAAAVAGSATARRRFTREAQAAAAVSHDHVVAVYGVHEVEGLPYLVMQYVAGESLQGRIDQTGPLSVEEVVRIGMQTASGLAVAHAQGLIHRDIKPANLLLENGVARVKITDFGLARMADDVSLTQAGVVAGTPEYMSPEQARGETVDHRADLFSLGGVLYACCTGVPPFRGPSAMAVLRRVSDEQPTPIRSRNADVPAWLEALIARLMAKDPAERFPSAAEVAALLEGYLAHLRQPALIPAPPLPLAPGQRGQPPGRAGWRRRWSSLVAALVLFSVLGVSLLALRPGAPPAAQDQQPAPAAPGQAPVLRTEYPEEYHPALKGNAGEVPGLLVYGPDASRCVKFVPDGLRITLPDSFPRQRPGTGVVTDFGVRGDFEITVGYQILRGAASRVVYAPVRPSFRRAGAEWQKHLVAQALASQALAPSGAGTPSWPQALLALRLATLNLYNPSEVPVPVAIPQPPRDLSGAGVRRAPPSEVLPPGAVPKPPVVVGGNPTELRLMVVPNEAPQSGKWQKTDQNHVTLARQAPGRSGTDAFFVDATRWNNEDIPKDPWGNEIFTNVEVHQSALAPASANTGRLRLVRKGPTLYFFTSEPPAEDFTLLYTQEFGTEDLKNVRVLGSTGWQGASFDVLVTDLSIRAEGLPRTPAPAVQPPPGAGVSRWLVALLALSVLAVGVAASLGAWHFARTRRRTAPAGPVPPPAPAGAIVFKCPGCGKRLRARAEQAGSKPKCPQCGKEVVVPSVLPKNAEEQP